MVITHTHTHTHTYIYIYIYARKATRKPGIETSRTSYGLEASGNATRPSGEEMNWKSQRKLTHLLSCCKEVNTGPCGEVDPFQNEKKRK
jgi:hypothetical protein